MERTKTLIEDMYPLSPMQEGMLFHTLFAPSSGMYFEQFSYSLDAGLNVPAFKQVWQRVIDRHPVLRTAFIWERRDTPFQVVYRRVKFPWEEYDWRGGESDSDERLEAFLKADRERGFVLSEAPLLQLTLIRMTKTTYQFTMSFHHMLMDGWCSQVLFQEVFAFYEAFCRGADIELERPRPYRDYILWLQQQDMAQAEAFWRQTLKGVTGPTPLVVDRAAASPDSADEGYTRLHIQLSAGATAALQTLARQHHLTTNTFVQGAWALLLNRYSGEQDVVFGVISSGRPAGLQGVESMVGLFLNTLPLRVQVAPAALLLPWLKQLQALQVEMRQYEYSPLMKIHGWSGLPQTLPLFETILAFENYPRDLSRGETGGLSARDLRRFEKTNYPLGLVALPGAQLQLELWYDTLRFDRETIARMLEQVRTLLEDMAAHPDKQLSALRLLPETERQRLLVEWNATAAPYPDDQCIHQIFEAQAARTPNAVALIFDRREPEQRTKNQEPRTDGDATRNTQHATRNSFLNSQFSNVTYAELNERANQLAHYLRKLGVGPEVPVGVCMERSVELVVGLLGVLKAGGAYVPLSPTYPVDRLRFMLEDSQASVLLTTQEQRTKNQEQSTTERKGVLHTPTADHVRDYSTTPLPAHTPTADHVRATPLADDGRRTVINLDADWDLIAQQPQTNLDSITTPDSPAYVIYTSGSTGTPKGVVGLHRGAVNRFHWMWQAYPFAPDEVCCQKTALSFVDSVWETFGALLQGVPMVIIPEQASTDLERFVQSLAEAGVTRIVLVPSLLRVLLDTYSDLHARLPRLRHWVSSGEALDMELTQRFYDAMPQAILINLYGSSEVAADVLCCDTRHLTSSSSVPIGRPIANIQAYVLDRHLSEAPIGVPGEILVGGAGLARGYWNRPDLTAERFVPNPFGELEIGDWRLKDADATISNLQSPISNRLYRTGDLGRYLPSGEIEYLGRIDQQINLHGLRIEPGEIEAVLNRHPLVQQSAVVARNPDEGKGNDGASSDRLVAYVVPAQAPAPTERAPMPLSLFYFAADEPKPGEETYRLYLEGAKFADQHGFTAVWTPERHFHEVAGIYPNPSVLSAALAVLTQQIHLRAGSVVMPLQHPLRVAEEWAIVDNLSKGRAGISFTSGWVPNDFAFYPEHFANKRDVMFQGIRDVQALWRGEALQVRDGVGNPTEVKVFPRPIQAELPVWLTCTGDPAMFKKAGELGVNVLTALLGQTVEELAPKIALYREALARHGHDPHKGLVTIMMHAFVGEDYDAVIEQARGPFTRYIQSHVGLIASFAKSMNIQIDEHNQAARDELAAFAFERYSRTGSLIGTPQSCLEMVERLRSIGVGEIAGLIDFGIDVDSVLEGLKYLKQLQELDARAPAASPAPDPLVLKSFLGEKLPGHMVPSAFVMLDALPLTPNGKLDRRALPSPAAESPAQEKVFVAPRTPVEQLLAQIWADVLKRERISVNDRFFDLGGDSIRSIQVIARASRAGIQIIPKQLFLYPTIAELAGVISPASAGIAEQGLVEGPVPLTPIQHWFFEQAPPEPQLYSQTRLLELRRPLELPRLEQAVQHLLDHHDALRLRFVRTEGGWQQTNAGRNKLPIARVNLAGLDAAAQDAALALALEQLHSSLDLEHRPLIRIAVVDYGPARAGQLAIVSHQLAIDPVSWPILIEDLQTVYEQLAQGVAVTLPSKTTSFKQWAERLPAYAQTAALEHERAYWLAPAQHTIARLPVDSTADAAMEELVQTLSIVLSAEETHALVQEVPQAYRAQIDAVLLTALAQSLATWTDSPVLLLDLELNGRETPLDGVDLSRTVGWFRTIAPLLLDLSDTHGTEATLKTVKEQLHRIPQQGIGYGLLRYLRDDTALRAQPQAELLFSYQGQLDQQSGSMPLIGHTSPSHEPAQRPRGGSRYLLEVSGSILDRRLRLDWTYSTQRHQHATIARLADACLEALRMLIAGCTAAEAPSYTPSDFPQAELKQEMLDKFIARISKREVMQ